MRSDGRLYAHGCAACGLVVLALICSFGSLADCEELEGIAPEVRRSLQGAWKETRGSPNVIVALLDSGVNVGHPTLKGHLVPGWSVITGSTLVSDSVGHGTAVAGVFAMVAPKCRVMPVQIVDGTEAASSSAVVDGIHWAVRHNAAVIHLGYVCPAGGQDLQNAIHEAIAKGIPVVVPTGNHGRMHGLPPSSYPGVIGVGAVDEKCQPAEFSNRGLGLTLCAPGTSIRAPMRGRGEKTGEGTSFASAFVAGVAALIRSVAPRAGPGIMKEWLAETAMDGRGANWDPDLGFGIVDPQRVVQLARRGSLGRSSERIMSGSDGVRIQLLETVPETPIPGGRVVMLFGLQNVSRRRSGSAGIRLAIDGIPSTSVLAAPTRIGPGEGVDVRVSWTAPEDGSERFLIEARLENSSVRRLYVVKVASRPVHRVEIEGGEAERDPAGRIRLSVRMRNSGSFPEEALTVRVFPGGEGGSGYCARIACLRQGELGIADLGTFSGSWFRDESALSVSVDPVPGQSDLARTKGVFAVAGVAGRPSAQWQSQSDFTLPQDQAHNYFSAEARKIYSTAGLNSYGIYVDEATNNLNTTVASLELHGEDWTTGGGDFFCGVDRTMDHYWVAYRGDNEGGHKYQWAIGIRTITLLSNACRRIRWGLLRFLCNRVVQTIRVPAFMDQHTAYQSAYRKAHDLFGSYVLPSYAAGKFALSYHYLGRVGHLLADMGVPAHAHGAPHGFDEGGFLYEGGLAGYPGSGGYIPTDWGDDDQRIMFYVTTGGSDDVEAIGSVWSRRFSVDHPQTPWYQIPNLRMEGTSLRDIFLSLWKFGNHETCDSPRNTGRWTSYIPPACFSMGDIIPVWGGKDYFTTDDKPDWHAPPLARLTAAEILHSTVPATVQAIAGFYKFFRDTVKPGNPDLFEVRIGCGVNTVGAKATSTSGPGVGVACIAFSYSIDDGVTWDQSRLPNSGKVSAPAAGGVYQVDFDETGLLDGAGVVFRAQVIDTGGTDSDFSTIQSRISVPGPPSASVVPLPACVTGAEMLLAMDSVFSPAPPYALQAAWVTGSRQSGSILVNLRYDAGEWSCQGSMPGACAPMLVHGMSLLDGLTGVATGNDGCGTWAWGMSGGSWGGSPKQLADPYLYPGFSGAGVCLIRETNEGWSADSDLFFHFDGLSWAPASATLCSFCCTPPATCSGGAFSAEFQNISFSRGDPANGWATTIGHLAEYSDPGDGLAWRKLASPVGVLPYVDSILTGVCVNSKTNKWVCGAFMDSAGTGMKPLIARSTGVGLSPATVPLAPVPAPFDSPSLWPMLIDIAFFEPDVIRGFPAKAVAVGFLARPSSGTAPVIAYIRNGCGEGWLPLVLDVSPLMNPFLIKVRFVSSTTAYAIGWAIDPSGALVPLLVKITI